MVTLVGVHEFGVLFEEEGTSEPFGIDVMAHPLDQEEPAAALVNVVLEGVDFGLRVFGVVEGSGLEVVGGAEVRWSGVEAFEEDKIEPVVDAAVAHAGGEAELTSVAADGEDFEGADVAGLEFLGAM